MENPAPGGLASTKNEEEMSDLDDQPLPNGLVQRLQRRVTPLRRHRKNEVASQALSLESSMDEFVEKDGDNADLQQTPLIKLTKDKIKF